jgi:hypothetical protein
MMMMLVMGVKSCVVSLFVCFFPLALIDPFVPSSDGVSLLTLLLSWLDYRRQKQASLGRRHAWPETHCNLFD